VSVGLAAVH